MKIKRDYSNALPVALKVVELLTPLCTRIEIAGSIRRKCAEVGDIEIVAIPKRQVNLFGEETGRSLVTTSILEGLGFGVYSGGEKYKKLNYNGHQVDLFLQTAQTWGMNMMIRTGPMRFSQRMVTDSRTMHYGLRPPGLILENALVYLKENRELVPLPEERDVFAYWGMDYIEPEDRVKHVWM
jgi:DNA polymerase/3'-5' exonuclease PolX